MATTTLTPTAPQEPTIFTSRSRWQRMIHGPDGDPPWVRPALLTLLGMTALLYLWNLSASGWANAFYSAAAQAGSQNWEAFFYASSDAANSITVDKTPASIWVMALSVRLFGLNSWSLLVPQALMGVASVGLLYATVRRSWRMRLVGGIPSASWTAPAAGLIAGTVMALTPVAVLMFKFNNPDALLVLLLIGAAYALVRACEAGSAKWMALVGVLIGFGFLTKMLQAFLVLPVFAVVYLIASPNPLPRRLLDLLIGFAALIVSAGWWVAIAEFTPASMRPYIGGSQTNSVMELVLGYNGLGRLTGEEVGSVGGGMGWGETGLDRMFNPEIGGQVAWLIPAAIILGFAGLWLTRRAARTDPTRAALLMWGGWLAFTGVVFSLMSGIFHPYYTVALAPAIGAVVGVGFVLVWEQRNTWFSSAVLSATTAVTAAWSFVLLQRSPDFLPWLAPAVLLLGLLTSAAFVAAQALASHPLAGRRMVRRALVACAIAFGFVALAGPAAYAVQTAATAHTGSLPSAGPQVAGSGPGGMRGPGAGRGPGGMNANGGQGLPRGAGMPGGAQFGRGGGGAGGLLNSSTPSTQLTALLEQNAPQYTWVAAAIGSQNASGYQLATGDPVMPIGGFNGSDPSPTLAQFQEYISQGKIHYFIASGGGPGGGGPGGGMGQQGTSSQISQWVTANFTAQTVDGVTLYDLTQPAT